MKEQTTAPLCPNCHEIMEPRSGRKGPFWGCPKYRETGCRGTAPMPLDEALNPTGVEPGFIVVVDTETTGTGPLAEVIEIAVLVLFAADLRPVAPVWSGLARPRNPIPPEATAVHGITDEMVTEMPSPVRVVVDAINYAEQHTRASPAAWLAHNASFDLAMIDRALGPGAPRTGWPVYCSLALAREAFPRMRSHRMEHLAARLGLPAQTAHRAFGDVQTTAAMVRKVLKVWDDFNWGGLRLAGRL